MSTIPHSNMGQFFDETEAELIRQFKAITPEQRAEEERLRQVQRDWEAAHTAFATPTCPHCDRELEDSAELAAGLCTSDDCPRHDATH